MEGAGRPAGPPLCAGREEARATGRRVEDGMLRGLGLGFRV